MRARRHELWLVGSARGAIAASGGAAAPGYVRTVIAGANQDELAELAALRTLDVDTLDERYRPFSAPYNEDVHHAETFERALANLTRRYYTNDDICEGVESWACAFAQMAHEADIPPVFRLGVCAWLARAGLAPTAASSTRARTRRSPATRDRGGVASRDRRPAARGLRLHAVRSWTIH